jgi:hypothetical protein
LVLTAGNNSTSGHHSKYFKVFNSLISLGIP